jgi:LacI family transcriptional regulator
MKPLDMYRMPAFPVLFSGVQEAAESAGLNLVFANWPDDAQCPPLIRKNNFDGILIMGRMAKPERLISMLKVPAVWFFREHSDPDGKFDHVFYDNSRTGEIAAKYLVEKGCRRLCFINPYPSHEAMTTRKRTFIKAAEGMGVAVDVFESAGDRHDSIVQEVASLLVGAVGGREKCDGIFAPADDVLLAVHNCLKLIGKKLERDIRLIGCNNDPQFMGQMHPRPATIDIKLEVVGRKAVEQLLLRMQNPDDMNHVEIFVKPNLVTAGK